MLVTLLYYVSLVFVNANLHLLLATCLFSVLVFWIIKEWWLTIWFILLITLPLAKGRTILFTLIPKEDLVARNAIFDINYILSFYLSDVFLALLCWQIVRQPLNQLKKLTQTFNALRWLGLSFLLFLLTAIWPHRDSALLTVVLFSCAQLVKTALLFLLPITLQTIYRDRKKLFATLTEVALFIGIFFQTALSLMQTWNGGPLGWYIEAVLPLGKTGEPLAISTMENRDILRVTGSFFDPSLLGTYLFSLMIWLWYQKLKVLPNWLKWVGIFAANISILLTSNRLLMLSLVLWWSYQALIFFKQYHSRQKELFEKNRFNWLAGLGILLLISVAPYFIVRLNSLSGLFAKYGSGTYRIELARFAIRLVHEQPWGVGLNLSPYYLATQFNQETVTFDPSPPHNIIFQLLAETGYAGFALSVWIIYLIYRPTHITGQRWPKTVMSATGMAGLAFLYCAQFYPVFINQIETFSWLLLFLGFYWAEKQNYLHVKK